MREIRPYGCVRGVRRNPYPYRDTPPPDAEGSAKTLNPKITFREGKNVTPPRQNHHTPGQQSAVESGQHRAAKRTRITARIDGPGHPGIRNGSAPADGKAAPQPGAANTQLHS